MPTLKIPYSDDLLLALGQSKKGLERELRFWGAVKLYELRRLSLGKASELAGMTRTHFMEELGYWQIPLVVVDEEYLAQEFAYLRLEGE